MNFVSFIILLAIAVFVAVILHFVFNYKLRQDWNSIFSEIVFGWIGAWLGSPVLGHWFTGWKYENVYIIPAILGALALLVIAYEACKAFRTSEKAAEKE